MAKKKETQATTGEHTNSPQPLASPAPETSPAKAGKTHGKKTKLTKCSDKEASAEPVVKRGPGRPKKYPDKAARQRAHEQAAVARGGWTQDNRPLNNMQIKFCHEYILDFKQTAAAIRAGYSVAGAKQQAYKLMRNPRVIKLLEDLATEARSNHKVAVTRTMKEYEKLAFFDPADIFDEHGAMKPIDHWPADCRAAITSIQTKEETDKEGNVTGIVRTIRLASRREALADIAKMAGMLTDNVNLNIYSPDGLFNKEPPVVIDMTTYTPEEMVAMARALMPSPALPPVDTTEEDSTDDDTAVDA